MGKIGAAIGGILGALLGYAIYWWTSLPWWQQLLIGIGGVAGAGILMWILLAGGGLIALAVAYSVVKR